MSALLYASALVDAHLGRIEEARDAATRGIALSERCGDEVFRLQHLSVLGFLELSVGDPEAADRILRPLAARLASAGWREPSIYGELPNAIEALVELGELGGGAQAPGRFAGPRQPDREPLGRGQRRPLRRADPGRRWRPRPRARRLERALTVHDRLPQPFDRARTLLALGAIQRRTRKRGAARESLERALAIFDELGATLWAEKARSELARIGGRTPAGDELTPTERRIAELVAMGKTNKEVAAQLFITPRTVEGHLTHIYAKLGVRSRAELAHRMSVPTA